MHFVTLKIHRLGHGALGFGQIQTSEKAKRTRLPDSREPGVSARNVSGVNTKTGPRGTPPVSVESIKARSQEPGLGEGGAEIRGLSAGKRRPTLISGFPSLFRIVALLSPKGEIFGDLPVERHVLCFQR